MNEGDRMLNLEHDLKNARQQINGVFKELESMKRDQAVVNADLEHKMDRLLVLLEGDPAEPSKGFINRIIAIETFITKFEKLKSYYAGSASGIVFIVGGITAFVLGIMKFVEIIQNIINPK